MWMSTGTFVKLLLFIMMLFRTSAEDFKTVNCGGEKELYDARGVIQTPNFPHAFAVPIRCRWVIDASNFTNGGDRVEVYIYLTQLFVRTGLTITEYKLYEKEAGTGYIGSTILELPPPPGIEYQFVRTNLTYLVIDFELDMLEGNHLRVLHGLMDVYGFNITYEISTSGERPDWCTVNGCSLVGHCYASADFSSYKCSCFEGFYGENCGNGPLCGPGKNNCANGASCRYAGETTVVCDCAEKNANGRCEITNSSSSLEKLDGTVQCPYDEKLDNNQSPCLCQNPRRIQSINLNDQLRFVITVKVVDTSVATSENSSTALRLKSSHQQSAEIRFEREMERHLKKAKLTNYESVHLINITQEIPFSIVYYHFFINKSDENRARMALEMMKQKKVIPNLTYQHESYTFQLLNVSANVPQNTVHEGKDFILSCIVRGSSWMTFQWYKDGVLINASMASAREMWSETKKYDEYKICSTLGIHKAGLYDAGTYTCQVKIKDWREEQCKSVSVSVKQPPRFKVKPLYKTVTKGENVTLLCLSKNGWEDEEFGYTWVHGSGGPLRMDVPHVYYEDLYRGGSVLYVNNIQKSETFICNTASVSVNVLDVNESSIPFCREDGAWNVTLAGTSALRECPENYSDNIVRRICAATGAREAAWQMEDFSECLSNTFVSLTEHFYKLSLGYSNDSVTATNTLSSIWVSLIENNGEPKFLPGEGESIVHFLGLVYKFLVKNRLWLDFYDSSDYFFKIVDLLLQYPTSIINKKAIFRLSDLMNKWFQQYTSSHMPEGNKQNPIFSTQFKSFQLHFSHRKVIQLSTGVTIRVDGMAFNHVNNSRKYPGPGIMVYKNLSRHLLPDYVSNQFENNELVYERSSPIIQLLLPEIAKRRTKRKTNSSSNWLQMDVEFQLPVWQRLAAVKWHICCGLVLSLGHSWSLNTCKRISTSTHTLTCSCDRAGLFATFVAELPSADYGTSEEYQLVAIIGCAVCFLQCIISLCILLFRWLKMRSTLGYLKLQVCFSTATSMILFLYGSCDPSIAIYPYLLAGLQMFLATSMTSHIGVLMIMYIDIVSIKKIPEINRSVIAVMMICPMIMVVVSPLTRRINGEKVTCWWLCKETLILYINLIVGLIFFLLFVLLYTCLLRKLFFLWNTTKVERALVMQRLSFLHCTTFIFLTTMLMVVSSTFYVNIKTSTSQCVFGSSCAFLGFAIFISYIPENGILLRLKVGFPSVKRIDQKCVSDICINSVDLDVQRTEVEMYDDGSLNSNRSNRCDEHVLLNTAYTSTDLNPSSPKSKKKRSVAFPGDLMDQDEESNAIESTIYGPAETSIVWPTTCSSYISTSGCPEESSLRQSHPEMLTTRVCVELGVMKNPAMVGDDSASGKNGSTVVICSVDVEPCPGHIVELNEVKFTANAIGSLCSSENGSGVATHKLNELPSPETTEPSSSGSADDARTNVLDRISQDLDYLLNRSPSPTRSRKNVNAKLVNHSPTVLVGSNQNRDL